ncbi:MAG: SPOR domain-containing protein [Chitinophagaceae bacterium]|nr:MAG: SPOR domain-containing protein [Chitinophagaceae bacterium]
MNRFVFILFVFILIEGNVNAQTMAPSVKVNKDPRIDLLVKKQVEANEISTRDQRRSASGYRILVINTPDRAKATEAKTRMYQAFPELKSYLSFQSPKFHLKVGNFRDRNEAEVYLESIKLTFPTGVYIVRDTIEVDPVVNSDSTTQQPS